MYKRLFGVGVLAIPFSGIAGLSFLGEYSMEAAFYPFAIALLLFVFGASRERFSVNIIAFLLLLSVVIIVGFFLNYQEITGAVLKERTGLNKFISSVPVLLFGCGVSFMAYSIASNDVAARKYILTPAFWSFLISSVVALVEVGGWFNQYFYLAYDQISYVFRSGRWPSFSLGRLQSVTFEPSVFGLYLGFTYCLFRYAVTPVLNQSTQKIFRVSGYIVIALMIVANARTATVLLVGLLAAPVAIRMLGKLDGIPLKVVLYIGFPILVVLFSLLVLYLHDEFVGAILEGDSVSNLSRYASNVTAFLIFLNSPVFGSGLGQYAFNAADMLPDWAWQSYEIQNWFTERDSTWPPVYSLPLRIAAELGIAGLFVWYGFILSLTYNVIRIYSRSSAIEGNGVTKKTAVALFIGLTYVILSGVSYDSFRNFGVWIIIGLAAKFVRVNRSI